MAGLGQGARVVIAAHGAEAPGRLAEDRPVQVQRHAPAARVEPRARTDEVAPDRVSPAVAAARVGGPVAVDDVERHGFVHDLAHADPQVRGPAAQRLLAPAHDLPDQAQVRRPAAAQAAAVAPVAGRQPAVARARPAAAAALLDREPGGRARAGQGMRERDVRARIARHGNRVVARAAHRDPLRLPALDAQGDRALGRPRGGGQRQKGSGEKGDADDSGDF